MRIILPAIVLWIWFASPLLAQEPNSKLLPPTLSEPADLDADNPLRTIQTENGLNLRRLPPDPNAPNRPPAPGSSARAWLQQLREELHSGDTFRAISAVAKLREMGAAGATTLAETLSLEKIDDAVSYSALRALDDIGPASIPALMQALENGNDKAWTHVGIMLDRLGARAASATPALTRILINPATDVSRRIHVASLLESIGPGAQDAVPALLDVFEHEQDDDLREAALHAVARIGNVPKANADRLLQFLLDEDQDAGLRVAVSKILARQHPASPAVLPALIGLLHPSHDESVCCEAVGAIGQLGSDAADALPALQALLQHESRDVRLAAVEAIGRVGGQAESAIAALVRMAQLGDDEDLRAAASKSIGSVGPPAITQLIAGLGADDLVIREKTLAAITTIGPAAKSAQSAIVRLLDDVSQADLHLGCIEALEAIRADAALSTAPLVRIVGNATRDIVLRSAAANALHDIQGDLQTIVPVLTGILHNNQEVPAMRAVAALSLGKISPTVVPDLLQALRDEILEVRLAAAQALCLHDESRQQGLSAMIRELAFPDHVESVAIALEWAGPPAIPQLGIVLRDKSTSREHRLAAVDVLGRIGGNAAELLVTAMSDDDDDISSAAEIALMDVGPKHAMPPLIVAINERVTTMSRTPGSERDRRILQRMQELIVDLNGAMGGPGKGIGSSSPYKPPPPKMSPTMPPTMPPRLTQPNMDGSSGSGGGSTGSYPMVVDDVPAPEPGSRAPDITVTAKAGGAEVKPGWKTVKVFYGTNRKPINTVTARRQMEWHGYLPVIIVGSVTMFLSAVSFALSRSLFKAALAGLGLVATLALAYPATKRTIELERSAGSRPGPVYGGESSEALEIGACEITIPDTHRFGELESPSLLRLEIEQDPTKHIVVRSVREYEPETFYSELKGTLTEKGSSILVFVHGYNVSFDDAARRTAQMACDLEFPGAPLFFSWPSQGNWYEYREDERQVELAVNPLKTFLQDVARRSGATSIHLVAHSMGNRALTAALREIEVQSSEQQMLFNQVVLAAPDIDTEVFRQRIVPAIQSKAQHVTLYASSNDLALVASRTFNSGDLRVGDSSNGLLIVPGIDTIDVSEVDTSLLGHSYYGDNPTVLTDLKDLLLYAKPADGREALEPMTQDELKYWIFRGAKAVSRSESAAQHR